MKNSDFYATAAVVYVSHTVAITWGAETCGYIAIGFLIMSILNALTKS